MASKGSDRHCCVPLCTGNGRKNPNLSFHKIPSKPEAKRAWIQAIRRDPGPYFKVNTETVVCSRHFKPEDFKWTPVRKTLKADNVPSVFEWTKESTPRRPLSKYPFPEKRQKVEGSDENTELLQFECTILDDLVDIIMLDMFRHCAGLILKMQDIFYNCFEDLNEPVPAPVVNDIKDTKIWRR